jgi:hypothetical protein
MCPAWLCALTKAINKIVKAVRTIVSAINNWLRPSTRPAPVHAASYGPWSGHYATAASSRAPTCTWGATCGIGISPPPPKKSNATTPEKWVIFGSAAALGVVFLACLLLTEGLCGFAAPEFGAAEAGVLAGDVAAASTVEGGAAAGAGAAEAGAAEAGEGWVLPKVGSSGGPTAGKVFPKSVKQAAKAENPDSTCVFCRMKTDKPQIDHAQPRAKGGNATLDNAQLSCGFCNASKGAREWPVNAPPGYSGAWPPPWRYTGGSH